MNQTKTEQEKFPTQIISLPSKGKLYPSDNPLSCGTIELKIPTTKHEDILMTKNLVAKGVVIDVLLKDLIVNKNINYDDILLCDKDAITFASRVLLYGEEYKTGTKCSECGKPIPLNIDLGKLESIELRDEFTENLFEFTSPTSKDVIKFKLLTVADDNEINTTLKNMNKNSNVSPNISYRLFKMISSINDNTDRNSIKKYVDNMFSRDSLALREYIKDVSPRINQSIDIECSECGHEDTIIMPFDVNFFWPSKQ